MKRSAGAGVMCKGASLGAPYLTRLGLSASRGAGWSHRARRRLCSASGQDPRMLFRAKAAEGRGQASVQSHNEPRGAAALAVFPVLASYEHKALNLSFHTGRTLAFRPCASFAPKRGHRGGGQQGKRAGPYGEGERRGWLGRKRVTGGLAVLRAQVRNDGKLRDAVRRSGEDARKLELLAVRPDGPLRVGAPCAGVASWARRAGPWAGSGWAGAPLCYQDYQGLFYQDYQDYQDATKGRSNEGKEQRRQAAAEESGNTCVIQKEDNEMRLGGYEVLAWIVIGLFVAAALDGIWQRHSRGGK